MFNVIGFNKISEGTFVSDDGSEILLVFVKEHRAVSIANCERFFAPVTLELDEYGVAEFFGLEVDLSDPRHPIVSWDTDATMSVADMEAAGPVLLLQNQEESPF